jgi:hypothetical protein
MRAFIRWLFDFKTPEQPWNFSREAPGIEPLPEDPAVNAILKSVREALDILPPEIRYGIGSKPTIELTEIAHDAIMALEEARADHFGKLFIRTTEYTLYGHPVRVIPDEWMDGDTARVVWKLSGDGQ